MPSIRTLLPICFAHSIHSTKQPQILERLPREQVKEHQDGQKRLGSRLWQARTAFGAVEQDSLSPSEQSSASSAGKSNSRSQGMQAGGEAGFSKPKFGGKNSKDGPREQILSPESVSNSLQALIWPKVNASDGTERESQCLSGSTAAEAERECSVYSPELVPISQLLELEDRLDAEASLESLPQRSSCKTPSPTVLSDCEAPTPSQSSFQGPLDLTACSETAWLRAVAAIQRH